MDVYAEATDAKKGIDAELICKMEGILRRPFFC